MIWNPRLNSGLKSFIVNASKKVLTWEGETHPNVLFCFCCFTFFKNSINRCSTKKITDFTRGKSSDLSSSFYGRKIPRDPERGLKS